MNSSDKTLCEGVWPEATCIVGFSFCALGKVVIIPRRRRKWREAYMEHICISHLEKATHAESVRVGLSCRYSAEGLLMEAVGTKYYTVSQKENWLTHSHTTESFHGKSWDPRWTGAKTLSFGCCYYSQDLLMPLKEIRTPPETSAVSLKNIYTNVPTTAYFEQNMDNSCPICLWTWCCGAKWLRVLRRSHNTHYCVTISVLLYPQAIRR